MENKVESASLIDLKAELYRKQEEVKRDKLTKGAYVKSTPTEKKPNIWSKKNAGVLERAQRDLEAKIEEEDDLQKSRKALEAKSKLYEKLTDPKYLPDESKESPYLVDFEQKAIDNYMVHTKEKEKKEEGKLDDPSPSEPGEEWVDYVDSLGRTRRCMKKDLPKFMEMDKELGNEPGHCVQDKSTTESEKLPDLMSSDMHRQMLREKWEREEKEAMERPVGPVHYENVRFDEVRHHGTSYFKFSKDEEERREQMKTLDEVRNQTKSLRDQREKIKEKRKALKAERLKKVKMRKRMKMGLDPLPSDEEEEKDSEDEEEVTKKEETEEFIGPLPREAKDAPVREWDEGKTDADSSWNWARQLEKLRDERPEEFAPPSTYSDNTKKRTFKQNTRANEFAPPEDYYNSSQNSHSGTQPGSTNCDNSFGTNSDTMQREERLSEFAPPPSYFDSSNIGQTLKYFKDASKR